MSDVRWEGLSHEEIYARVQQGPGRLASSDAEAAWNTVESTIRAVDAQLTRAVKQIGAGWQGRAADAVHGGMTVMSNWALDAAGDATLTKNGIAAQAEQAGHLRSAVPPPRTEEWNQLVNQQVPGVGLMSAMGDLGALEERMANDHAVAVDMMNRYSSQSSDNQRMMNYWTQPPTVVVQAVPAVTARSAGSPLSAAAVGTRAGSAAAPVGSPPGASGVGGRGDDTSSVPEAARAVIPNVAVAGAAPSSADSRPTGRGASAGDGSTTGAAGSAVTPGSVPATRSDPAVTPLPGSVPVGGGPVGSSRAPDRFPGYGPERRLPSGGPVVGNGVRSIVPGPPQPGSEPSGRLPRTTVPGTSGELPPRTTGMPAEAAERVATGRSSTAAGHGILPMGGAGAVRAVEQEHRRAAYLIDDSDAFADDRWFPPPVIGGDMAGFRG
jgi:PPE family